MVNPPPPKRPLDVICSPGRILTVPLPFSLRYARPFFSILDLSKTWGKNALNPEVFTEPGEPPVAPLEVLKEFSLYDVDISSNDKLSVLDHSLQYTLLKSLQAIPQVRSKASVALI